jgi:hypothetical protein
MESKLKNDITNAGYLFSKCVEETLLNCANSLDMMGYLFMENQFEGDKKATDGVHAQLDTIKSALTYCVEVLDEQDKKERSTNKQLGLLLDYYSKHRAVKLDDLSMCDEWLNSESSDVISTLSVEFIDKTKEKIRENRVENLNKAEHKLHDYMAANGVLDVIDEQSAKQAINECKVTNKLYNMAEEFKGEDKQEVEAA